MIRRWKWIVAVISLMTVVCSPTVFAFSDLADDPDAAKIEGLQKAGIIDGVGGDRFAPGSHVTYAQAVQLIVKGFKLNIDGISFIKEPKASDYFTRVPDHAWYAQAFIIAQLNGLDIPKEVDPAKDMTREQFAYLLAQAINRTASFVVTMEFILIADEKDINPQYMDSIQTLIKTGVVQLDKNKRFLPKDELKRSQAAVMLHDAIQFVQAHQSDEKPPVQTESIQVTIQKVTDDVNRVTLSAGMKPNPGYRLSIDSITFQENGDALIAWSMHQPDPGKLYIEVLTEAKAVTYVDSRYKPVAANGAVALPKRGRPIIGGPIRSTEIPSEANK